MGCSTCGGKSTQQPVEQFEVTYPDGTKKVVASEHAARVEAVMKPGSTYSKL